VAIQLKKGAKAAKSLRELSGTVAGIVLADGKPLMSVADVVKAKGTTVKGEAGGSIHVLDALRNRRGGLSLRVEVTPPKGTVSTIMTARERAFLGIRGSGSCPYEVTLADENNLLIPLDFVGMTNAGGGMVHLSLSYSPRPGQGATAKLLLRERKPVSVEMPFS